MTTDREILARFQSVLDETELDMPALAAVASSHAEVVKAAVAWRTGARSPVAGLAELARRVDRYLGLLEVSGEALLRERGDDCAG